MVVIVVDWWTAPVSSVFGVLLLGLRWNNWNPTTVLCFRGFH